MLNLKIKNFENKNRERRKIKFNRRFYNNKKLWYYKKI